MYIDNPLELLKFLVLTIDKYEHLSIKEKKKLIIKSVEEISAGKDGILNTPDDLVSPKILDTLKMMIKTGIVTTTIDIVYEMTPIKIIKTPISYCSYCCCLNSLEEENELKKPLIVNDPLEPPLPVSINNVKIK
jgi:hypothetical protein